MGALRPNVVVITRQATLSGVKPVLEALQRTGVNFRVLDLARPLRMITVRPDGTGTVRDGAGVTIEIGPDTGVMLWHEGRPSFVPPDEFITVDVQRFIEDCQQTAWRALLALPSHWINNARARAAIADDKNLQARIAMDCGLHAIDTWLSNSKDQFVSAIESIDGDFIALKSPVSWNSWSGGDADPRATYTRRVPRHRALDLVSRLGDAPVYIQPYIEKAFELRVTVVGDRLFACKIDSQKSARSKIDWRHYDLQNVGHSVYELPSAVVESTLGLMTRTGLTYSAIDMIVEPSGAYRFVEINPSGHYGWIEGLTAMPISKAIAEALSDV